MRFKKIYLPFAALILGGCYKTLEIELPEQELFSVFYSETHNDTLVANLRTSILVTDYSTAEYTYNNIPENFPAITGATITISGDNGQKTTLKPAADGTYYQKFIFQTGITYSAHINIPGKDPLSGSFVYPGKPAFTITEREEMPDKNLIRYRVELPNYEPGIENHYVFNPHMLETSYHNNQFSYFRRQPIPYYANSLFFEGAPEEIIIGEGVSNGLNEYFCLYS